jgi:hypothetical protein
MKLWMFLILIGFLIGAVGLPSGEALVRMSAPTHGLFIIKIAGFGAMLFMSIAALIK